MAATGPPTRVSIERYRLLNDGTVLSVTFTWEDTQVFRTPHSYEFRYVRAPRLYEAQPPLACNPFDEARAAFLVAARRHAQPRSPIVVSQQR